MRRLMMAFVVLWALPALGQVTLTSPNGANYVIQDTAGGELTGPSPFSGWPQLCVRSCSGDACNAACAPADLYRGAGGSVPELAGDRQRALPAKTLAGLTVERRVYVPSAGLATADGFVRYLDSLTNNTPNPITVAVRVGSSGEGAARLTEPGNIVWRTSSDDSAVETTDRWLILDDANATGGTWASGVLIQGSGARNRVARIGFNFGNANDSDAFAWEYRDVTIGSGETASFLTVLATDAIRTDVIDEVVNLLKMRTVDVLSGLTDAQRRSVRNFDLDPNNQSPIADAGGPYTPNEGAQVAIKATSSSDPEGAPLQYEWDLDGDGEFDDGLPEWGSSASVTFADNGNYIVQVKVTDAGGKSDIDVARVTVLNVEPQIVSVQTTSPVLEGSALEVNVNAVDPGTADILLYDYDWDGDGDFEELGVANPNHQHRYIQDGVYQARVRVRDDDGGISEESTFHVVVDNTAPEISDVVVNSPASEGSLVVFQVIAQDPGNDPVTYGYDFDGDGNYEQTGANLDRFETRFSDNGLYTVAVRVCDAQAACSDRNVGVSILNARPVIQRITNTGPVAEGTPIRIDVTATDPGADTLTYAFDLDGDGDYDDDGISQAEPSLVHTYRQQGLFSVGVRVRDDDGGFITGTTDVTITNAPPTAEMFAPASVNEGELFEMTVQASDPGTDNLSYDWDLNGDGRYDRVGITTPTIQNSLGQEGEYTLRCRVNDGDGGEFITQVVIRVRNVRPTLEVDITSPQNEGAEVVVHAIADDPGDDVLIYSYDFDNDGNFEIADSVEPFGRFAYPDEGFFRIRVVVDDGANLVDAFANVEIVNVAPRVTLRANSPVAEGQELIFTAEIFEPGQDELTLYWQPTEDGPELEIPVQGPADRELILIAPDDARYLARVRVRDEDGGEGEGSTPIIITNAPPRFVPIDFLRSAQEGVAYDLVVPAEDPAGARDPLTFGLQNPPAGVEIEPETGRILWVPTFEHFLASPITLTVTVSDGDQGTAQTDLAIPVMMMDQDSDQVPDTWERMTCDDQGNCLDPTDPSDGLADPDGDGRDTRTEWEQGTDPWTYDGPGLPYPIAPADRSRVETLTPTLEVSAVESGTGALVEMEYEIWREPGPDGGDPAALVVQSGPVTQPDQGDVTWAPAAGLLFEDQWYFWRARARSGPAFTAWTLTWRFRTNATNQVPGAPLLRSPEDEASVSTLRPSFEAFPAEDGDDDELRYVFRIYRGVGDEAVAHTSGEGVVMDGFVQYIPTANLIENAWMSWDVVAKDEAGETSASSERRSFKIDTENESPTKPEIFSPTDDEVIATLTPTIEAGGSTDDDDTALFYSFRIRLAGQGETLQEGLGIEPVETEDGPRATWTPEALVENTAYEVDVFVQDDAAAQSELATRAFFVSATNDAPPIPTPLGPSNGAVVLARAAVLSWEPVVDPEGSPVRYVVEYCDQEGVCTETERLADRGFNMERLVVAGNTYRWRVQALDERTEGLGYSEYWTFTVEGGGGDSGDEGCACRAGQSSRATPAAFILLALAGLGLARRRRR